MADAAGFPAFQGCEAAPYADLLAELPVRERRLFPSEADVLAVDISAKSRLLDLCETFRRVGHRDRQLAGADNAFLKL
jgi:hypothetical protein